MGLSLCGGGSPVLLGIQQTSRPKQGILYYSKMSHPKPKRPMTPQSLTALRDAIRAFARVREWEQFHTPKNLVMALSVETAELTEHFQWLTPEQSLCLEEANKSAVAQEIGDVLIYLTRLADVLGIDPLDAAFAKMQVNATKYPVEKSRGHHTKYDKLG